VQAAQATRLGATSPLPGVESGSSQSSRRHAGLADAANLAIATYPTTSGMDHRDGNAVAT
jgi:hypothetical protein